MEESEIGRINAEKIIRYSTAYEAMKFFSSDIKPTHPVLGSERF